MKIYSFPRGGIPYYDPTAPVKSPVVNAYLPSLSVILLGNKINKVYPVVSVGEQVREGMLIGKASGNGTVNVHATVPGRIIRKATWKDGEDAENDALVIKMEGAFEKLGKKNETVIWTGMNGYDIQRTISDYGITEMENTERPLAEMISINRRENEKLTLVVRCVFDDPWLVADYALCVDRMNAVIEGAAIVSKACFKVSQIVFAVSHREKELADNLILAAGKLLSGGHFDIPYSLVITGSRYPQRKNRELEMTLRTCEKKENTDFGALLILGPAVLAAVYDAVVHKKPILDRYVAVGGSAVKKPQIMKIRIGTRIGEVIEQCGGFKFPPERIITGSPLSGKQIIYLDEPVTKTCYAIAAMSKSHEVVNCQRNCINCGECRAVCPVGLDPQNIYKQFKKHDNISTQTMGCQGCGCCKIVCPSALPLFEVILGKNREENHYPAGIREARGA
ncbi:MAG: SLBB domain-containing protein [Treponema sp.]|nr:SLBB domain-containing protein [Treponema sp.]